MKCGSGSLNFKHTIYFLFISNEMKDYNIIENLYHFYLQEINKNKIIKKKPGGATLICQEN